MPSKKIRYVAIGDNVDTLYSDGLQFLTFKLSFNDYYAQDISNKIKSVKNRKIEKGEYQAGIPPYGYKKDTKIKNHLVPDLEASKIVQEIFDRYVNKGMSTLKIADELNDRKITAPGIYLQIPTFMKNKSKNPQGYIWSSTQIAKILRNQVYIGSVVGRKFEKISHKVEKVRATKKEEYIIVKNKHEPLIDKLTWEKAQDKLNKYKATKTTGIHEHPLKELVYCAECGGKAVFRLRQDMRKSGKMWKQETFICSSKNINKGNCHCKPMEEQQIIQPVQNIIKREIQKINYTNEEILHIYQLAQSKVDTKNNQVKERIKQCQLKLEKKERAIQELYYDKVENIIAIEDFNKFYQRFDKERQEMLEEIKKLKMQKIDRIMEEKEIQSKVRKILKFEQLSKEFYSKLIKKIEFNSEKTVMITLVFKCR